MTPSEKLEQFLDDITEEQKQAMIKWNEIVQDYLGEDEEE